MILNMVAIFAFFAGTTCRPRLRQQSEALQITRNLCKVLAIVTIGIAMIVVRIIVGTTIAVTMADLPLWQQDKNRRHRNSRISCMSRRRSTSSSSSSRSSSSSSRSSSSTSKCHCHSKQEQDEEQEDL